MNKKNVKKKLLSFYVCREVRARDKRRKRERRH